MPAADNSLCPGASALNEPPPGEILSNQLRGGIIEIKPGDGQAFEFTHNQCSGHPLAQSQGFLDGIGQDNVSRSGGEGVSSGGESSHHINCHDCTGSGAAHFQSGLFDFHG
jgi:hypothetical protein